VDHHFAMQAAPSAKSWSTAMPCWASPNVLDTGTTGGAGDADDIIIRTS
jgi:hypothetical protein